MVSKKRRKDDRPVFVNVSHHDKFVRRIFNNSSFADGGRFYGGWWQRIDGEHRKNIRMPSRLGVWAQCHLR